MYRTHLSTTLFPWGIKCSDEIFIMIVAIKKTMIHKVKDEKSS